MLAQYLTNSYIFHIMVEVTVADLALDPNTNMPILILKEQNGERILPIWIGMAEAGAIAIERSLEKPERPLTHDLMKLIIDGMENKLIKIIIDDLKENTFYAKLYLQRENDIVYIDARPSDAVALALRCKAPIYVEDRIFGEKDPVSKDENTFSGLNPDELRDKLRNIDPSDFGKFSIG